MKRPPPHAIAATRGMRPKTPAVIPGMSAERATNSTPVEGEFDDVLRLLISLARGDEREDRRRPDRRFQGLVVLPCERQPCELLEPGHFLRVAGRPQPKMEVRSGRVAGRAEQSYPLPSCDERTCLEA